MLYKGMMMPEREFPSHATLCRTTSIHCKQWPPTDFRGSCVIVGAVSWHFLWQWVQIGGRWNNYTEQMSVICNMSAWSFRTLGKLGCSLWFDAFIWMVLAPLNGWLYLLQPYFLSPSFPRNRQPRNIGIKHVTTGLMVTYLGVRFLFLGDTI